MNFKFKYFVFAWMCVFLCLELSLVEASEKKDNGSTSILQDVEFEDLEVNIEVLELKDMDVREVFKFLSQESGYNIVHTPNVRGKISIYLNDVTAREALSIIADINSWVFVQDENLITVMSEKDYEIKHGRKFGQSELVTKVYMVRRAGTSDVGNVLEQLKSDDGKIIIDERSQTILMTDYPDIIRKMFAVAKKLDVDISTRVFDVYFVDVEDLTTEIEQMLTVNVGKMKYNEKAKKIIVSDIDPVLEDVEQIILSFDQKQKEVLIEAKIIQVTLDEEHKFGIDWQAIIDMDRSINASGNFDILGANDKKGSLNVGALASDNYEVMLEALKTVGESRILSSPRISALDGEEAKILVGSEEPYVTTTTTTTASGPATTAEDVKFIDVGVKLFVTPKIHKNGFITMKIKPEVSSVVRNLITSQNNIIPVVDTSQAETKVMVKDKTTVIIGGLIKEENILSTNQVPVLGDVPVIGAAFKNERDFMRTTEIVIFLTPKIVQGDVDSVIQ